MSALAWLSLATSLAARAPGPPQGLLVELLRNPEAAVVTDPRPELGWIVNDERRGAVQGAYQILVAASSDALAADRGELWDSGRIRSPRSIGVEYAGRPLAPNRTYWWKVRTWDRAGHASPYSQPQAWHTGLFGDDGRAFPGESRWTKVEGAPPGADLVLENRQRPTYEELEPHVLRSAGDGRTLVDFAKAAFGTLRFAATAPEAGGTLKVYLGERKTDDGAVHKNPGTTNIGFVAQEVRLRPGTHEYTVALPRHRANQEYSQVLPEHMLEVTPFRYAELLPSAGCAVSRIRQVALFYPFDDTASSFDSSDERLDRIWELCKHTLKATPFLGLYADGNRERMPYEADAYIQQLGHYAVDRELTVARYTNQFLIHNPSWPTEWQMHAVLMAYTDYLQTGDTEHLRANYDSLRAKTLIGLARADGLISTRTGLVTPEFLCTIHRKIDEGRSIVDNVDWPPSAEHPDGRGKPFGSRTPLGERDGHVFAAINTVVNAFHFRSLVAMEAMARAAGKIADAKALGQRAAAVRASFNAKLLDRTRGLYRDGEGVEHASLHSNMFPLAFGLVPDEHKARVVSFVKSRGMACSVYGAQYLLEALFDAGQAEAALGLMTADGRRGWLNMLRAGATMTTEAWDEHDKPNLTWNHAWGSAPANILARKVVGVAPLEPGFGVVRIRPQVGALTAVTATVPTIRGSVKVAWKREAGRTSLEVVLPANTRAEVWLPASAGGRVLEGGAPLGQVAGLRVLGRRGSRMVVQIPAGRYRFASDFSGPSEAP